MSSNDPRPTRGTGEAVAPTSDPQFLLESQSRVFLGLERIITEIAPTEIPVLLVGESGTGKEVVALLIHRLSRRQSEPFVKLVCTTLSSKTFEDPGGSSNGDATRRSLFSAGTVYLDEITDLELSCQPKLLRALPDGTAVPDENCLRGRLISSTTRNLEEQIRAGRFREELYYRLNGACLRVPALRHRKEDIPGLLDLFLEKYALQFGRPKPSLSSSTKAVLVDYPWPGNIRQLENAAKKLVALGDERLALMDLDSLVSARQDPPSAPAKLSLKQASRAASRQAERELILKALGRTHWNRKRAAQQLQISYKALLYKLKQLGLGNTAESFDTMEEGG